MQDNIKVTGNMLQATKLIDHPPITTIEDLGPYANTFITAVTDHIQNVPRSEEIIIIEAFCAVLIDALSKGHYRTEEIPDD